MFRLYFKHLFPSYKEWRDKPFAPWKWSEEGAFFSILSFFESSLLQDDFSLKDSLQCPTFMDSGAFAAETMGFTLDPYEVAEMHRITKADLIVPLDRIILAEDSEKIVEEKVAETLRNTEILLDFCPPSSEVVGPLQGLSPKLMKRMFDKYRELGIKKFALGGLVFQSNLNETLIRIKKAREITQGYSLHLFGKFLHPKLLKLAIKAKADSVDGYGYILSSVRGLYILKDQYKAIGEVFESQLDLCACSACQESSVLDFQRGDKESQYALIVHNIHALIQLKKRYIVEIEAINKNK